MLKAATSRSFGLCVMSFLRPLSKLPYNTLLSVPARLVFMVYLGTFGTANIIDTMTSFQSSASPDTVTSNAVKFVGTAAVATGLTVYKDSRMARCFGKPRVGGVVPAMSYGLFTLRDAITIFASFNLPVLAAPHLTKLPDNVKSKFGSLLQSESGRVKAAQFLVPAVTQLVTTPIHLLGLNMYNHPDRIDFASRCRHIARDFQAAVLARVVRIVPAFGFGGVINTSARRRLMTNINTKGDASL